MLALAAGDGRVRDVLGKPLPPAAHQVQPTENRRTRGRSSATTPGKMRAGTPTRSTRRSRLVPRRKHKADGAEPSSERTEEGLRLPAHGLHCRYTYNNVIKAEGLCGRVSWSKIGLPDYPMHRGRFSVGSVGYSAKGGTEPRGFRHADLPYSLPGSARRHRTSEPTRAGPRLSPGPTGNAACDVPTTFCATSRTPAGR